MSQRNGAPLPCDHRQDPVQVGKSECLQMHGGRRELTKRMVGEEWAHVTQTGLGFYKPNQQTLRLGMPAIKQVAKRTGTLVRANTQVMPSNVPGIGRLSVPNMRGKAASHALLCDAALNLSSALPATPDGKVLLEDSVTYLVQPDGG